MDTGGLMYVMYRVAYAPGPQDPPDRDRTLRDFTAVTGREAEKAAREWAASRNQMRPRELREQWPWVLERWNGRTRDWEQVNAIP